MIGRLLGGATSSQLCLADNGLRLAKPCFQVGKSRTPVVNYVSRRQARSCIGTSVLSLRQLTVGMSLLRPLRVCFPGYPVDAKSCSARGECWYFASRRLHTRARVISSGFCRPRMRSICNCQDGISMGHSYVGDGKHFAALASVLSLLLSMVRS